MHPIVQLARDERAASTTAAPVAVANVAVWETTEQGATDQRQWDIDLCKFSHVRLANCTTAQAKASILLDGRIRAPNRRITKFCGLPEALVGWQETCYQVIDCNDGIDPCCRHGPQRVYIDIPWSLGGDWIVCLPTDATRFERDPVNSPLFWNTYMMRAGDVTPQQLVAFAKYSIIVQARGTEQLKAVLAYLLHLLKMHGKKEGRQTRAHLHVHVVTPDGVAVREYSPAQTPPGPVRAQQQQQQQQDADALINSLQRSRCTMFSCELQVRGAARRGGG